MRALRLFALALVGAAPLAGCTGPGAKSGVDTEGTTREILDAITRQQAAWNRGDLAAFMEIGYWRSPELTFFSGGEDSRGYDEMLARYRRNYEAPGKERGTLAFTRLEVVPLAHDASLARGRWDLDYADKPDVGGLFTLVLRRFDEGWRIVHDHTSVDG
jgi:beta-aspartyl-peptidase (threonine type)